MTWLDPRETGASNGDVGCFWKLTRWWCKRGELAILALLVWQILCTPRPRVYLYQILQEQWGTLSPTGLGQVKSLFTPCKRNFGTCPGHALYLKIFELSRFYLTQAFGCKQYLRKVAERKRYRRCKELWLFCVCVNCPPKFSFGLFV